MKIKTSELKGKALEYAVATCEGRDFYASKLGDEVDIPEELLK